MQHFKAVADYIEQYFERGACDRLLVGCRDDVWSEIEPQLHAKAKQHLVGHFRIDPKAATPEQVKQMAREQLAEYENGPQAGLIREVIGEAQRNGTRRDRLASRTALAGNGRGADADAWIQRSMRPA